MLLKTNRLVKRIFKGGHAELTAHDVAYARKYISHYWKKLERYHPKDDETLVGLPHPYLVPAYEEGHAFDFNEMYYWDSFFMVQGMLQDKKNKKLVVGILENLLAMQRRFKIIPNASRTYLMGRSQPPFLTTFIFDVYEAFDMSEGWLREAMATAEQEYHAVWMGTAKPNWRQVYKGLSRYFEVNMLNDLTETESGWDMTTRFSRRALSYLPVDLNALLYKYETDFAKAARIFGDDKAAGQWEDAAHRRKKTMDELMWSDLKKLYFDYNFAKEKRGTVASLAAYFPMWAGMVDEEQAEDLVKSLKRFEEKGGLATTEGGQLNQVVTVPVPNAMPTQWAYPNGWAPLQYIVIKGLQRYGYHEDAKRITMKWLATNVDWFNRNGVFLEKYNVAQPDKPPVKGLYPSLTGFGWTNAVFERLCQEFIDK